MFKLDKQIRRQSTMQPRAIRKVGAKKSNAKKRYSTAIMLISTLTFLGSPFTATVSRAG
jgi:hypothetical protein